MIVFVLINLEWQWNNEHINLTPPEPRRVHATVFSMKPKPCLIIIGGIIEYNCFTDDVIMIELETKNWSTLPFSGSGPTSIARHSANIIGDQIYVIGGCINEKIFNTKIYMYSLATFEWTTIKDKMEPRYEHVG